MKKSAFFKNTSILIFSNIISGILTFAFSVVLSREIGSRGMGLYQLVMPLYSILIFATSGGTSITMSRIAAEKKAEGRISELYRTVKLICLLEIIWTIVVLGIIALSANFISTKLLLDKRTYYSILAFFPALLMISLSSTLRGTYYGVQRVFEPALIDIIEKIVKIAAMYPLVLILKKVSIEVAVAGAVLSLSCGECVSFFLFFFSFSHYRRRNPTKGKKDNDLQLVFNVMKMALPISLENIVTAMFSTATAVLIPKRLQAAGMSYEAALGLLGKLQGMVMNIALFPMIITSAFNVLLIPSIVESVAKRKNKLLNHRINSAIGLALITSCLAASIILQCPVKIGSYFYNDVMVGRVLGAVAPVLPLVYVEYISYAIINGLGEQTKLLVNSLLIQSMDILFLYIFVGIPKFNIFGYSITIGASAVIGIFINYRLIIKRTQLKIEWSRIVIIPILCVILAHMLILKFTARLEQVPLIIGLSIIAFCIIYLPLTRLLRRTGI